MLLSPLGGAAFPSPPTLRVVLLSPRPSSGGDVWPPVSAGGAAFLHLVWMALRVTEVPSTPPRMWYISSSQLALAFSEVTNNSQLRHFSLRS